MSVYFDKAIYGIIDSKMVIETGGGDEIREKEFGRRVRSHDNT
jgi:hypothetical protein